MRFVLASASPRRKELLRSIGLSFEVVPSQVEERQEEGESVSAYVERLAREKAAAVAFQHPGTWVLAADTVVFIDGHTLEKPDGKAGAAAMLSRIAGREHTVFTGVALVCRDSGYSDSSVTSSRVRLLPLTPSEIDWYVKTGEPMDKAGAYAVQGVGGMFIESIDGSYTNVVGLPLSEVFRMMKKAGIHLLDALAPEGATGAQ